ncbi:hypothetical protein [Paenibacillus sp. PAMC21692]|uniref:hypothetical protein n=1 Tax=Paenibacillus sp. PAMC21692 TaxID=2762320 RepID=UPI00164D2A83|nr:hypothetical protein [Paenibacillus sp. PAMC21692]QNK55537.1 hypothetical protein H7F31_23410 [Paenibacillus sp. PAMC21692]
MNWSMTLTLLMPLVLLLEWPQLKALKSKRDKACFVAVWLVATAAMSAEWAGVQLPRPMEIIRVICAPINAMLP